MGVHEVEKVAREQQATSRVENVEQKYKDVERSGKCKACPTNAQIELELVVSQVCEGRVKRVAEEE